MLLSGFQHFTLAVAPQDDGPQLPRDGQNTLALQQTGVYTELLPSNINYYLILFILEVI